MFIRWNALIPNDLSRTTSSIDEKKQLYELLLSQGRSLKKCTICNRGMDEHEVHEFERNVS